MIENWWCLRVTLVLFAALTIAGLWAGKRSLGSTAAMAGKGNGNFPLLAPDDLMKQKQHGTCVARSQKVI